MTSKVASEAVTLLAVEERFFGRKSPARRSCRCLRPATLLLSGGLAKCDYGVGLWYGICVLISGVTMLAMSFGVAGLVARNESILTRIDATPAACIASLRGSTAR